MLVKVRDEIAPGIRPSFIENTADLTDGSCCVGKLGCNFELDEFHGPLGPEPDGPYEYEWGEYSNIASSINGICDYYDLPGNHDRYGQLNRRDGETEKDGYKYQCVHC
jgi:hypothetical protein